MAVSAPSSSSRSSSASYPVARTKRQGTTKCRKRAVGSREYFCACVFGGRSRQGSFWLMHIYRPRFLFDVIHRTVTRTLSGKRRSGLVFTDARETSRKGRHEQTWKLQRTVRHTSTSSPTKQAEYNGIMRICMELSGMIQIRSPFKPCLNDDVPSRSPLSSRRGEDPNMITTKQGLFLASDDAFRTTRLF
ncbi:hypothetical protein BDY19DRAFT_89149 [Irpex rosettiformis]|uniref:Uncharacterized protein n=1 Tax=Irpex rosettiformis TaxID=378272 RepID=A0ACB8U6P8_9APHY|nr:hypothetical protein BDY19DRAFT_89149 [Irpex rosettiformis]